MPTEAKSIDRRGSTASKAPARISASTARRLTWRLSTRRQKSNRSTNAPPVLARGDDRRDGLLARALDPAEPVADPLAVDGLEPVVRRVHVGRQDREAVRDRVVVERAHLVGVVHHQRQVRRHEGRRVMRLQVRGLVGDERVGGRVRLVEAVAGELLHQVEERSGLGLRHAVPFRASDEDVAVPRHLVLVLLAHCACAARRRRPACSRRSPARSASPVPGRP